MASNLRAIGNLLTFAGLVGATISAIAAMVAVGWPWWQVGLGTSGIAFLWGGMLFKVSEQVKP